MIRQKIKKIIKDTTNKDAKVEHPADPSHGDYSTNIALVANLDAKKLAAKLKDSPLFERVEVKNRFINFFISPAYLQKTVSKINLPNIGKSKKIQVEFISANPTGPLTIGNGRGGFVGDCLANVLASTGFQVQREYYINDRGKQIQDLEKGAYKGEKRTIIQIQKANQQFITKKLKIKFDNWFNEKSLYRSGEVEKAIKLLAKKKLTYEKQGALWLKTSKFGDDKDRVLIRENNEPTYLLSDTAYFKNRMRRGFKKVIMLLGADHHGYINRFKALVKMLGYKQEALQILLMQMVRLIKDKKEFKMSKRKGDFVTLEWLIDEVGLDASRFFFLMRASGSHMNFDLNLAKEKSEKNPVYYIQYAHARIQSILRKAQNNFQFPISNFQLLNHPAELKLIKQLVKFPEAVEGIAKDFQVQRLPQYALDLAKAFHQFYQQCPVITDDKKLMEARLGLVLIAQNILQQSLDLMGITAPKKM